MRNYPVALLLLLELMLLVLKLLLLLLKLLLLLLLLLLLIPEWLLLIAGRHLSSDKMEWIGSHLLVA
jgi:hypothetical protein